jgi:hypothetical protein
LIHQVTGNIQINPVLLERIGEMSEPKPCQPLANVAHDLLWLISDEVPPGEFSGFGDFVALAGLLARSCKIASRMTSACRIFSGQVRSALRRCHCA